MQRTFLRSDSEDIIRLHQYFQSTYSSSRSQKNGFTVGFVNKLLEELERARRQCHQLIDQNQQIEEALKVTKRELFTAKETIERLIVENKELVIKVKREHHHQQTPARPLEKRINHMNNTEPHSTAKKSASFDDFGGSGCAIVNFSDTQRSTGKGRKRSAEKRQQIAGMAENEQHLFGRAAKRSLVRKSSEREEQQNNTSRKPLASVDENSALDVAAADHQQQNGTDSSAQHPRDDYFTANGDTSPEGNNSKCRRSMSLPPSETPVIKGQHGVHQRPLFLPTSATINGLKNRASRMAVIRNSRISSSHGDLSRMAVLEDDEEDLAPPGSNGPWLFAEQAVHSFQTKRNFLRIQCGRCDIAIRFGVLYVKCARCKGTFHEGCRKQAPLPCVIRKQTPKPAGSGKHGRPRLGDFCPDTRPMVPPLITFCTFHLDKTTNSFEDLYQIDGDDTEVDAIAKQFQSNRAFPKLDNFHPLNIAACVKKFLGQIREPIIPYTYGKDICGLLDGGDTERARERLPGMVEDLPLAHMDTLGHLCRHWNRLIANSNGQLSVDLLAVSLGPVVFGSCRPESPLSQHQQCIQSMAHLLLLAPDFWTSVSISPPTSRSTHRPLVFGTPLSRNPSQMSTTSATMGMTTPRAPPPLMMNMNSQPRHPATAAHHRPPQKIAFDSTMASNAGDNKE